MSKVSKELNAGIDICLKILQVLYNVVEIVVVNSLLGEERWKIQNQNGLRPTVRSVTTAAG